MPLTAVPAIGQFGASAGADVLTWHEYYTYLLGVRFLIRENYLDIASSGVGSERHSREDLR